jgi:hypothetical protein
MYSFRYTCTKVLVFQLLESLVVSLSYTVAADGSRHVPQGLYTTFHAWPDRIVRPLNVLSLASGTAGPRLDLSYSHVPVHRYLVNRL